MGLPSLPGVVLPSEGQEAGGGTKLGRGDLAGFSPEERPLPVLVSCQHQMRQQSWLLTGGKLSSHISIFISAGKAESSLPQAPGAALCQAHE